MEQNNKEPFGQRETKEDEDTEETGKIKSTREQSEVENSEKASGELESEQARPKRIVKKPPNMRCIIYDVLSFDPKRKSNYL